MSEEDTYNRACEIVWDTTTNALGNLLAQLEMIEDGKACHCRACFTGVVNALNSWVEWTANSYEEAEEYLRYIVTFNGVMYALKKDEFDQFNSYQQGDSSAY